METFFLVAAGFCGGVVVGIIVGYILGAAEQRQIFEERLGRWKW
jgi:ABC-type methionine transport system permease subunit